LNNLTLFGTTFNLPVLGLTEKYWVGFYGGGMAQVQPSVSSSTAASQQVSVSEN